jgi:hypothetical protein
MITACQGDLLKLLIVVFRQSIEEMDQRGTGVLQENHSRKLMFLCFALIFNCEENHTEPKLLRRVSKKGAGAAWLIRVRHGSQGAVWLTRVRHGSLGCGMAQRVRHG